MSNAQQILNPKQELLDLVMQYIVMEKMIDYSVRVYDRDIQIYENEEMVMRIYLQYHFSIGHRVYFMVNHINKYMCDIFTKFETLIDEFTKIRDGQTTTLYALKCEDGKEYLSLFNYILGT